MKRIRIVMVGLLLILLFRTQLYRLTITYTQTGERAVVELFDPNLLAEIDTESRGRKLSLLQIGNIAKAITNQHLSFTTGKVSNNPNVNYSSGRANCVGYSAMFNAVAQYLIKEQKESEYTSKHIVGQLYFAGINLHQFTNNPFYKDHDYNQLKDNETGEVIWIDPTVSDYLKIDRISVKKKSNLRKSDFRAVRKEAQ